ncbi:hypothetical protein HK105_200001, partial [Polyrhizophydium stewartii]
MIFAGYAKGDSGWVFYDPAAKTFVTTREAIFREELAFADRGSAPDMAEWGALPDAVHDVPPTVVVDVPVEVDAQPAPQNQDLGVPPGEGLSDDDDD